MSGHRTVTPPARWRVVIGWIVVVLNGLTASLWAFWGAIEAFHEGWWHGSLGANLLFTLAYLIPAAIFVTLGLIGLRFPRIGAGIILAFTIWFWWWWDVPSRLADGENVVAGVVLSGMGGFLAVLWWCGRAVPRRWAFRATWIPPLLVALVSGAGPAYRVATRVDDGHRGERTVEGNGLTLTWAPAGPGWPQDGGFDWHEARDAAVHLSRDGTRLEDTPQHHWRLPTMDEAVRSMARHGENCGGTWDAAAGTVRYERGPDKETPLWNPESEVIYWWVADAVDDDRAWSIACNGSVLRRSKSSGIGTIAFRLVRREPRPGP